jgi:hypothetical protein
MKLSRTSPRLVASSLAVVLMIAATQQSSSSGANAYEPTPSDLQQRATEVGRQESPRMVTVILHGLMVGRYWNGADGPRFELGIVKKAKEHQFSLSYYKAGQCTSIDIKDKPRKLVFEVRNTNTPIAKDIEMWHCPPGCSDTDKVHDSSLILNMEGDRIYNGVHRRKNLFLPKEIFKPLFYFYNGKVKTHTATMRLLAKLPNTPSFDIGSIAEVVMLQIQVNVDEQLVLAEEEHRSNVVWSVPFREIVTPFEVRVLNLGVQHMNDCNREYHGGGMCPAGNSIKRIELNSLLRPPQEASQQNCTGDEFEAQGFDLYYSKVFSKNERDRFRLCCPECRRDECYKVKTGETEASVPPYRCGMVVVRGTEIK